MNIICTLKQQEKLKMKMLFPLLRLTFVTYTGLWLLVSLFVVWQPAKAETITICSGQQKLATVLEFIQNNCSDSFGVSPPLYW
jgi:hypothetical protein